jgi:uncharacterized protein YjbI with pentapeptide repeats
MFRLDQPSLNDQDLKALGDALAQGEGIDARNRVFTGVDLQRIRAVLPQNIDGQREFRFWRFNGSEFADGCDFAGCRFHGVDFSGCEFGSAVSFRASVFNRARFVRAVFGDDISFEEAELGIKAEFRSAQFGNRALFTYATFRSSRFSNATFGIRAGFARSRFTGPAKCHSARFGPRANFTEASFEGGVDFGGADFGEKLQMTSVRFRGTASFQGASIGARARLQNWRLDDGILVMRSTHFRGDVTLHGAKVSSGSLEMAHAYFDGLVDLGGVQVEGDITFAGASVRAVERFGPMQAQGTIDLTGLHVYSPCAIETSSRVTDLSDARVVAPVRVALGAGDLVLDRLDTSSKLVLTSRAADKENRPPRLVSARGTDLGTAVVSGLDVKALCLQGAVGIDQLQLESRVTFQPVPSGRRAHREAIAEEHRMRHRERPNDGWYPEQCRSARDGDDPVPPAEIARLYRSLRKAREDSRDSPGAADFYYGEMEMRRMYARKQLSGASGFPERALQGGNALLLELYRMLGGYGVRPSRPLVMFIVLVTAGTLIIDLGGLVHSSSIVSAKTTPGSAVGLGGSLVFVLRSALLLPTSSAVVLGTGAEWVQIAARVLGPLSIGLFGFGVRARVQR